jgi:hypothetical protein
MALETLKGIKEIGGFKVLDQNNLESSHPELHKDGKLDWDKFDKEVKPNYPITIHHDRNILSFTIQNGPIKENGVNGCQVDTVIETAKIIVEGLNKKFPCRENAMVITKLDEALLWSMKRKQDREKRGVEGLNKK